jgi:hypothetical protein
LTIAVIVDASVAAAWLVDELGVMTGAALDETSKLLFSLRFEREAIVDPSGS